MILEDKQRKRGRHLRQGFTGSEFQRAVKELGYGRANGFGPTVFLKSCVWLSYRLNNIVSMVLPILHTESPERQNKDSGHGLLRSNH